PDLRRIRGRARPSSRIGHRRPATLRVVLTCGADASRLGNRVQTPRHPRFASAKMVRHVRAANQPARGCATGSNARLEAGANDATRGSFVWRTHHDPPGRKPAPALRARRGTCTVTTVPLTGARCAG